MMNAKGKLLFSNAFGSHTHLAYTLFNLVLISWQQCMGGVRWPIELQKILVQSKF